MKLFQKNLVRKTGALALSLLLTLSLLLSGATLASAQASVLTEGEIALLDAIDYDYVFSHVKYIADEIGIGVAGGPTEKRRAAYLAGQLESLGYEPFSYATDADGVADYFQTFYNDSGITSITGGTITVAGHEYPANAPNWSAASVYKGYETPTVAGDTVYFATVAEAVAADAALIAGKIVLTHRNSATFAPDVRLLAAKGAIAVVYFYNKYTVSASGKTSAESRYAAPTTGDPINIPVILTSYFDGQLILAALTDGGTVTSANVTVTNSRNTSTQNVLAIKKAVTPTDQFVLIGGHYDSVFGAIGSNDNTSGPASILGIAKALKDVPTKYNVIFAFWAAEEAGLRGSRYFYASTLAPGDYWKNGLAYYNLDMAASGQKNTTKLTIHTPYRVSSSDSTPIGSAAGEIFTRQAARYWDYSGGKWGAWWEEGVGLEYYGNCSDHASIAGANATPSRGPTEGIPQVYVFWRGPGSQVTELNYHVVGDRYDWPGDPFKITGEDEYYTGNYSIERAEILASIYALSVYESAGVLNDPAYNGISAGVSGDTYGYVGQPLTFTFSLENAYQVTSVELDFTLDAANITTDATGLEVLGGFTALPAKNGNDTVDWTPLGGTLWQGKVTLVYTGGSFTAGTSTDILKLTRVASQLGGIALTLNKVTVTYAGNYDTLEEAELGQSEVTVPVVKLYLIWDLNKDEKVDQLDLNVALSFYQAVAQDANWNVVNTYGYKPSDADVNNDGAVNLLDVIAIFAHYTA